MTVRIVMDFQPLTHQGKCYGHLSVTGVISLASHFFWGARYGCVFIYKGVKLEVGWECQTETSLNVS